MGIETVNRNKDSNFYGPYAGRDLYITMLEDTEREFVVTHNANIKPVSYFTGRETELQELRQRIEDGRKSVLVSGMGGIGKTHICRKLFEECLNKHAEGKDGAFKHIGYIEYDGEIDSSLQHCLKFKKQSDPEKNKEAVWKELEYLASSGKLLLFVDNVNVSIGEDPNLKRLMSIPGAIILTSRRRVFSKEFELYRIGFLSTEQCRQIYERIRFADTGKKVNEEDVPDLDYIIAKLAARHTITVEFLAHLAQTKYWTVQKLRNELEKNGFWLEYKDEDDKLVNIQKAYETLYNLSMLSKAEQNILEAFSVFPYIPLDVRTCNQWLLSDAGVSESDDTLMKLYKKGWLQFDMNQECYSLHPVFAQVIYEKYKPEMNNHLRLIESCKKSMEITEENDVCDCEVFIPFAENIIEKIDINQGETKAKFIYNLAYLLQAIEENERAEKWYEISLRICENIWREDQCFKADNYYNLACVCQALQKFQKAEKLYEKCVKIRESVLQENQPDILTSYDQLAFVYSMLHKYDEAEKVYEKCLGIRKKLYGENSEEVFINYDYLAYVCECQGNTNREEYWRKKCLKIYESLYGKNHIELAYWYCALAKIYLIQEKYIKAEELYCKILEILAKEGKKEDDSFYQLIYVESYLCMGVLYIKLNDDQKALVYFLKLCKLFKSIYKEPKESTIYEFMKKVYLEKNPEGNFEQWLEEKMEKV